MRGIFASIVFLPQYILSCQVVSCEEDIVATNAWPHIRGERTNIFKVGGWNIRRLSVKWAGQERLTTSYLHNIFLLASGLHETLEEFYLDFGKNDGANLKDGVSIREDVYRILSESPFHLLTILCLPYYMTEHLVMLSGLTRSCNHLEHVKLVHSEGCLQEGNQARRKEEVREAVQRTWGHVPASVKWISVKFRKLTRDTSADRRRIMTNVVWR